MVTGGHLDERRANFGPDPFGLGHQPMPDAPLARARIDDQGDDPDDPIVVLEPRDHVDGEEAEDLAAEVRHHDAGVRRPKPFQALDDVAGAGRIALACEESGDRVRVLGSGVADGDGRGCLLAHGSMVSARGGSRTTITCGPNRESPRTSACRPKGPAATAPSAGLDAVWGPRGGRR